jgi:hypothetical protein
MTPVQPMGPKVASKINNVGPTQIKNFDLMNLISTRTYFGMKTRCMERRGSSSEICQGLMFQNEELVISWNAPCNMVLLYLIERSLELYVELLNKFKCR